MSSQPDSEPSGALTPYRELADILDRLGVLLREARRARRLSLRDAAEQVGIPFPTFHRIERGEDCVLSNAARVVAWLDLTATTEEPSDAA